MDKNNKRSPICDLLWSIFSYVTERKLMPYPPHNINNITPPSSIQFSTFGFGKPEMRLFSPLSNYMPHNIQVLTRACGIVRKQTEENWHDTYMRLDHLTQTSDNHISYGRTLAVIHNVLERLKKVLKYNNMKNETMNRFWENTYIPCCQTSRMRTTKVDVYERLPFESENEPIHHARGTWPTTAEANQWQT